MARQRRWAGTLLLAVAGCVPTLVEAQIDGNVERGFAPGKLYSYDGFEAINEFSGNLVLTIPFPTFRVGGDLSYGLSLVYNIKIWDLYAGPEGDPQLIPFAELETYSNAGIGWRLSLGELTPGSAFIGPDGAEHVFASTLHLGESATTGFCYSRDGSYYRLIAAGLGSNCAVSPGVSEASVEARSGLVYKFTRNSAGLFQLTELRDRFNNKLTISYPTDPPTRWVLWDGHRTHTVYFRTAANREVVDRIELAKFGSGTAVYQFSYAETSIQEHCGDLHTGTPNPRFVPLLTSVSLPAGGGSYQMSDPGDYYTTCVSGGETVDDLPGVLHRIRLPTRGCSSTPTRRTATRRGASSCPASRRPR